MKDPRSRPRPRSSTALVVLVFGLFCALLYFAHAAFIPVALALLFTLLLSSPVEALHRKRIPRGVSAVVILVIFLSILGAAITQLRAPAQEWLAGAPHAAAVIQRKIGPVARLLQRIDVVTNRAGHLTDSGSSSAAPAKPSVVTAAPADSETMLGETRTAVVSVVTVIILTLFLLAAGEPVLARMSASFASNAHAAQALLVIRAVRREVGRYYATVALINFGLGLATFSAMWALKMPNPLLWGVLAGVLNFIPYIGSAATFLILTTVAFISFDSIAQILAVAGGYLAIATLEGQVVQPLLVGRRLELSPVIVFLALWFGGWFWGIPGMILAIPSLVALKVAAEHHAQGVPLVEFLSPGKSRRLKPRAGSKSRTTSSPARVETVS